MKNVLVLICLMISFFANGQLGAPLRKNAFTGEAAVLGLYNKEACWTINYERIVVQSGGINYYIRIGGGKWYGPWDVNGMYYRGPKFNLGCGAYLGKRSHHLDVQAGPELYIMNGYHVQQHYNTTDAPEFRVYALAGYRFQQPGRPLMFRMAIATYGVFTAALGFTL